MPVPPGSAGYGLGRFGEVGDNGGGQRRLHRRFQEFGRCIFWGRLAPFLWFSLIEDLYTFYFDFLYGKKDIFR